jgi:hypothetical protein
MICSCKPGQICMVCCPDIQKGDAISIDARYIANKASKDAGRIVKHLWIIFVALPRSY